MWFTGSTGLDAKGLYSYEFWAPANFKLLSPRQRFIEWHLAPERNKIYDKETSTAQTLI